MASSALSNLGLSLSFGLQFLSDPASLHSPFPPPLGCPQKPVLRKGDFLSSMDYVMWDYSARRKGPWMNGSLLLHDPSTPFQVLPLSHCSSKMTQPIRFRWFSWRTSGDVLGNCRGRRSVAQDVLHLHKHRMQPVGHTVYYIICLVSIMLEHEVLPGSSLITKRHYRFMSIFCTYSSVYVCYWVMVINPLLHYLL